MEHKLLSLHLLFLTRQVIWLSCFPVASVYWQECLCNIWYLNQNFTIFVKKYNVSGKSFSDFCISLGKNTWWESASWVWRRGTNYYQSNSVARSSDHCRDKWTNGDGHNHNTRLAVLHDEIDYADSNLLKFTLFIINAQRHTWMHLHWHSKQTPMGTQCECIYSSGVIGSSSLFDIIFTSSVNFVFSFSSFHFRSPV